MVAVETQVAALRQLALAEAAAPSADRPRETAKPSPKRAKADPVGKVNQCRAYTAQRTNEDGSRKRCGMHGDAVGTDGLCETHRRNAKAGHVSTIDDVVIKSKPAKPSPAPAHDGETVATCKGTAKVSGMACQRSILLDENGYCRDHAAQATAKPRRAKSTVAKRSSAGEELAALMAAHETLGSAALAGMPPPPVPAPLDAIRADAI
jgi:hypothetical protein